MELEGGAIKEPPSGRGAGEMGSTRMTKVEYN